MADQDQAFIIAHGRRLELGEWILGEKFMLDGEPHELFGVLAAFPDSGFGIFLGHFQSPQVRVTLRDVLQGLIRAKVVQQALLGLIPYEHSGGFNPYGHGGNGSCGGHDHCFERGNRMCLTLMYTCGLRVSEATNLYMHLTQASMDGVQGSRIVLNYLARYVHRVAITNSRIQSIDNGQVRFRYRATGTTQTKVMTVGAEEFIRRFLQHVLPRRIHKVRYYGLWSTANRKYLRQMQQILSPPERVPSVLLEESRAVQGPTPPAARPCPHCRQGVLIRVGRLPLHGRAPP